MQAKSNHQQAAPIQAVGKPTRTAAQTLFREGLTLHHKGHFVQAQQVYRQVLLIQPQHAEALHSLGLLAAQSQNFAQAAELISRSVEIDPGNAVAWANLGNAYRDLKQHRTAIACYDKALALRPDAVKTYFHRGLAFSALNQHQAAIDNFRKVISLKTDAVEAYYNCGNALHQLKIYRAAVECYDEVIALKPDAADAHFNRGIVLIELRQFQAAIQSFDLACALNPELHFVTGTRLYTKMRICDWQDAKTQTEELLRNVRSKQKVSNPFSFLAQSDSLPLQRQVAEIWVNTRCPANPDLGSIPKRTIEGKIRIGYFSADFHNHATAYLMAELFERHNKDRFELFAFSFGPNSKDGMRTRIEAAFDKFIDVRDQPDSEVALLCRTLGIDVAVDLKGFTQDERAGIFAYRAAPIQVSYLGYPGTMGAAYMDYLIADRTLIPEDSRSHYAEKIIYLPNSYQVNDTHRKIADTRPSRQELGLPESGFVFCCFNNNFKITPSTFDGWMRILKQVDRSVLWLLEDNPLATKNLREQAQQRNVNPERLVFARRMPLPEHLARQRAADLFIDTLPYNAHTTASDALWAGLPVLTCTGEAFASRVAASLLGAIDLPELITSTQEDYEALAIQLATHPEMLQAIRRKLESNRLTTPLFDTKLFAQHIEDAYSQIVERYQAGLPAENILVGQSREPQSGDRYTTRQLSSNNSTRPQACGDDCRSNTFDVRAMAAAETYHKHGNALLQARQYESAIEKYDSAIDIWPAAVAAYINRGLAWQGLKQHAAAIRSYDEALNIAPNVAEAYFNRGLAFYDLNQHQAAIDNYDRALALRPNTADTYYNRGIALHALKQYQAAVSSYDNVIALEPCSARVYYNRGIALHAMEHYQTAIASYDNAIALQPSHADAYFNRGNTLCKLKQYQLAVSSYENAIAVQPDYAEVYLNRGVALNHMKQFEPAIDSLAMAISIKTDSSFVHGMLLHTKMKICDWNGFENALQELIPKILHNERMSTPFPILALAASLPLQRRVAEIWVHEKSPVNFELGDIVRRAKRQRIRLGYFSADFRDHAVSFLTAGLFETHDREKFEVYAFS
ncbi:MAG: tetratricopeptide repeat protein, partial [Rhodoferax sp.]